MYIAWHAATASWFILWQVVRLGPNVMYSSWGPTMVLQCEQAAGAGVDQAAQTWWSCRHPSHAALPAHDSSRQATAASASSPYLGSKGVDDPGHAPDRQLAFAEQGPETGLVHDLQHLHAGIEVT